MDKELNHLYALFAIRLGNVNPALVKGLFQAWEEDPAQSLPARATQSGVINPEQSSLLVSMVKQAVQSQGGDAAKAMNQFGGDKTLRSALAGGGGGGGALRDSLGQWAVPATAASSAVAFLAIVVMGSGWYSASSERSAALREMQRLEDGYALVVNEVAHLKQLNQMAEEQKQQADRALALAEDELAFERRRRREATVRADDSPLPPPPGEEEDDIPSPDAPIQALPWQQSAAQQAPPRPVTLSRQQLERQAGNLNADTVLRQLQPDLARNAQGQVVGVTSQNFSAIPIARQLGLQNGDVIANINGVNITGIGSYAAIEQAVQRGGPISVTILRNGQPLTASFNLR
jgi:hypothetical protein